MKLLSDVIELSENIKKHQVWCIARSRHLRCVRTTSSACLSSFRYYQRRQSDCTSPVIYYVSSSSTRTNHQSIQRPQEVGC